MYAHRWKLQSGRGTDTGNLLSGNEEDFGVSWRIQNVNMVMSDCKVCILSKLR